MAIARYHLKIKKGDKVLVALPTTTKDAGHNSWTLPNDLDSSDETPSEVVRKIFAKLSGGVDLNDVLIQNTLEYSHRVDDDGKVDYRTEIILRPKNDIEFSMVNSDLMRYDKTSELRIPKYVKYKWVPESELYYWLTRSCCRLEKIRVSYFYPDNVRPVSR